MTAKWSKVLLGNVLTERCETPPTEEMLLGEIPIISKIGFNDGRIELRNDTSTKTGMILIRPGDLVVSGINAAKGAIAVYDHEKGAPIAATIHYASYIPNKDKVDTRYLWWFLRSETFREILKQHLPGGIKTELKAKRFLPIPVPLPSLPEQRRIVAKIENLSTEIEEACASQYQAIQGSEALSAAHLNELFGNYYQGKIGNLNLVEFDTIENLSIDVADGPHKTPIYVDEGIPFITVQNITSGRIKFENYKCITEEAHEAYCRRAKAEYGDVMISKDGTIGIPCYIDTDKEFSFFVSVALIKPKRARIDGEFLVWALRSPYLQERIHERSRGDMIRHLVLREIKALVVPCPPIKEQRNIAKYLDMLSEKVEALKQLQQQIALKLNALIPSILDKAFKGELVS